jgi:hypothetical protein
MSAGSFHPACGAAGFVEVGGAARTAAGAAWAADYAVRTIDLLCCLAESASFCSQIASCVLSTPGLENGAPVPSAARHRQRQNAEFMGGKKVVSRLLHKRMKLL